MGVTGVYPPLVGSSWVIEDPEVLGRILVNGLNGPIQVLGKEYNGNIGIWTQWTESKAEAIGGVMTYIRQEWGNQAPDVTSRWQKGTSNLTELERVWSASSYWKLRR